MINSKNQEITQNKKYISNLEDTVKQLSKDFRTFRSQKNQENIKKINLLKSEIKTLRNQYQMNKENNIKNINEKSSKNIIMRKIPKLNYSKNSYRRSNIKNAPLKKITKNNVFRSSKYSGKSCLSNDLNVDVIKNLYVSRNISKKINLVKDNKENIENGMSQKETKEKTYDSDILINGNKGLVRNLKSIHPNGNNFNTIINSQVEKKEKQKIEDFKSLLNKIIDDINN